MDFGCRRKVSEMRPATAQEAVDVEQIAKKANRRRPRTALSQTWASVAHQRAQRELIRNSLGSSFGQDAPFVTIGSSRHTGVPPAQSPGPAAYNVPADPRASTRRIYQRFPRAKSRETPRDGADMELFDLRVFPQVREFNIGTKPERPFYDVIDSPGPSYVPPSTLSARSHKIVERSKERKPYLTPAPGTYSPKYPAEKRSPKFPLSGPKTRDAWMCVENQPGPADYKPKVEKTLRREPEWTIGARSRLSKKRKNPNPPKSRFFGIDRFVVPLDLSMDLEEDWRYIDSHPELRTLIQTVMEHVIEEKPAHPLDFVREWFAKQKRQ